MGKVIDLGTTALEIDARDLEDLDTLVVGDLDYQITRLEYAANGNTLVWLDYEYYGSYEPDDKVTVIREVVR